MPAMPVVVTSAVRILLAGSNFAVPLPVAVLALGGTSRAPVRAATNASRVSPSSPPPQDPSAAIMINDRSQSSTVLFALGDFTGIPPAKLNHYESPRTPVSRLVASLARIVATRTVRDHFWCLRGLYIPDSPGIGYRPFTSTVVGGYALVEFAAAGHRKVGCEPLVKILLAQMVNSGSAPTS